MIYILDNSALKYLLDEFPQKLYKHNWELFEKNVLEGSVITDRETKKMLEDELVDESSKEWLEKHKEMFKPLSANDSKELSDMMERNVFDKYENDVNLIYRKRPIGIPFALSMAKSRGNLSTFVYRKNSIEANFIDSTCEKEKINHIEVEDMMISICTKHE